MKEATFDPAKELTLYFRCNRAGSKDFVFVRDDGSAYSFIYDELELNIYKNQGDKKKLISLTHVSGITLSSNTVTASITKALSNIPEGEYYWELYRTDLEKTWLTGDAIFHNGKFDGVGSSTETITVTEDGDDVNITIQESGIGEPIQFQDEGVDLGNAYTDTVDFVGAGVTATRSGDKVTVTIPGGSGSGTVTSVGALSPLFTTTNPTTTPSFTAVNQNANIVYAGPSTGLAAAPTFRALVRADLPFTGTPDGTKFLRDDLVFATPPGGSVTYPYVTPEDYGAVGDGVTDDTAAIQAAVDSLNAVWFDTKTYLITAAINLPDNAMIFGSGGLSVIKTTSNISMLEIVGKSVTIQNIRLLGNATGANQRGVSIVGNAGLTLYYADNHIKNVIFDTLTTGLYVTLVYGRSSSLHTGAVSTDLCIFVSCTTGVNLAARAEYCSINNGSISGCTTGVIVAGGNNSITNNDITDCTVGVDLITGTNGGHGIVGHNRINHCTTAVRATSVSIGMLVIANYIFACNAITLTGSSRLVFAYNNFETVGTFTITLSTVTLSEFSNNRFGSTPTITLSAGSNISWRDNQFDLGTTPDLCLDPRILIKTVSTTTYSIVTSDNGYQINFTHASGCTVTLPNGLQPGFRAKLVKKAAGNVTVTATGTLQAASSSLSTLYQDGDVIHEGSNVWGFYTAVSSASSSTATSSPMGSGL